MAAIKRKRNNGGVNKAGVAQAAWHVVYEKHRRRSSISMRVIARALRATYV